MDKVIIDSLEEIPGLPPPWPKEPPYWGIAEGHRSDKPRLRLRWWVKREEADTLKTNILNTGGPVEWTIRDLPMGIRVIAES